ncbi:hypothetical protein KM043_002879 [Ampulex compressa]|nr:hypothetical protein KM043_002879 [Ampulex compressa]
MVSSFKHLRDEKSFTDVTLACDGQTCKAHKMVLSACSPYFKTLLEENPSKHPIIILKDVAYSHLQAILEFMYAGELKGWPKHRVPLREKVKACTCSCGLWKVCGLKKV